MSINTSLIEQNSLYMRVNKTNFFVLSLQANYTDWATATCWRNLVPTFEDGGVSHGQRSGSPMVFNHLTLRSWVDPVPDPLLLRKSRSAGYRTWDLCVSIKELSPLDHRGGRHESKAIPFTGCWGPWGCETSRIPYFLHMGHTWRWGCQPYTLVVLYFPDVSSGTHFC
jgi:hypothetical protein